MAGSIRNLKNPFTGKYIFPVTKTRAVFNEDGTRLDNYLNSLYGSPSSNILINSNFVNPVNQRGVTFPYSTTETYFIDRWFMNEHMSSIQQKSNGLRLTAKDTGAGLIVQTIEDNLVDYFVTVSAKINDKVLKKTWKVESNGETQVEDSNATLKIIHDGSYVKVSVLVTESTYIDIEWVKLEYGKGATPYVPRLYAEELQLCKRYYQIRSTNNVKDVDLVPNMRTTPTIASKGSNYSYDAEL